MRYIRLLCASATLAIIGAAASAVMPAGFAPVGDASARESYVCMTDDGYGRRRPCSANYKAANPNWRGSNDCFTDDGYGRKRPCSANYKAKYQK